MKNSGAKIGLVFSGGGARAAYQVGCLRALTPHLERRRQDIAVIIGASIGAVNGLIFASSVKNGVTAATDDLAELWIKRRFENTFEGSISRSFLRSLQIAFLRYRNPSPSATDLSIFNPAPLERELDGFLAKTGGLKLDSLASHLNSVAVTSTIEGDARKSLLITLSRSRQIDMKGATFDIHYLNELKAKHGLASAALPCVLPRVDLDLETRKVKLVDGGIADNHPVDPALRLGAEDVVLLDVSGRRWWFDRFKSSHDKRPTWEIPASDYTFCLYPNSLLDLTNQEGMGQSLKLAVGASTRAFMRALGPVWPIFRILKTKMGEELAYEVASYVALCPEYTEALMERGERETTKRLEDNPTHPIAS